MCPYNIQCINCSVLYQCELIAYENLFIKNHLKASRNKRNNKMCHKNAPKKSTFKFRICDKKGYIKNSLRPDTKIKTFNDEMTLFFTGASLIQFCCETMPASLICIGSHCYQENLTTSATWLKVQSVTWRINNKDKNEQ